MNCDDFKDLIVVRIYGKLTSAEKNELKRHSRECSKCAQVNLQTQKYHGHFEVNEDIPLPIWEKSWQVILGRVMEKKKLIVIYAPYRKFAFAVATLLVVFILGYFAGRQYLLPTSEKAPFDLEPGYSSTASFENYAENLELLFISFMNRSDQLNQEEYAELEKKVVADMLDETRLLKYLVSQRGELYLKHFLEELELILVSISNLRPEDRDSADQLNRFIREKDLKFRLRQLANEKTAI